MAGCIENRRFYEGAGGKDAGKSAFFGPKKRIRDEWSESFGVWHVYCYISEVGRVCTGIMEKRDVQGKSDYRYS